MRIAVIGTGVSGLICALGLHREHEITVFEADRRIGGHVHTIEVPTADGPLAVDTGFIVFNEHTYPNFCRLLDRHGVRSRPTTMSFGVCCERSGVQYASHGLDALFAQRRNLVRPSFLRMIRDIVRWCREARALLHAGPEGPSLGSYLAQGGYSQEFVDHYLVPMCAAIWSAEHARILEFPAVTLVRFLHNHGLLSVRDQPTWRVIEGGSRRYVDAITRGFRDRIVTEARVVGVRRRAGEVIVTTADDRSTAFDHVVIATHSDQALAMLEDPSPAEGEVLGAIRYQPNEAVLHTDRRLLPSNRRAWACWNIDVPARPAPRVRVTYHMNRLQRFEAPLDYCVTLNRTDGIDPQRVIARIPYAHPIFDAEAVAAQRQRSRICGVSRTHYCGAYWGHGFHEDGVDSALAVLRTLAPGFSP